MRRFVLCLAVPLAFCTLGTASARAATTIGLRQGVSGYSGCQDTYIDRNEQSTPMGGLEYLWQDAADTECSGSNYSARTMIRFDLSMIPPTAHVLSAALYLYGDDHRSYHGSSAPTDCFFSPVTRPWSEPEATWQQAASGEPWSLTPGDPDDSLECFFDEPVQPADIGVWARVDVTPFVQSWVDGSLPNYGMVGMTWWQGQDERAHRFRSSQWPDPAYRPRLEITYEDPGVVSLPPSYLDPRLRDRADSHVYQHLEDQPLDIALSDMVELGARYVYTGYWVDLHDGEPVADQLLRDPELALDDEQVLAIVGRGLIPVFRIAVTRNWGEATVEDVYEVAQWYAARYIGKVHWFNYHGEFNNGWYYYGTPSCSPEHITARVVAAADGVKRADPENKMMLTQLGCLAPYDYVKACLPYGLAEATDQWGYGYGESPAYYAIYRWQCQRDLRRWVLLAAREAARVGHPISCQREGMISVDESAPTHRVQGKIVALKTVMDFVAGMGPAEWYKLYDHSPENYQIVADDLVTRYEAFYVLKNLNTYLDPAQWSGVYVGIEVDHPCRRFAFRDDDGSLIIALWWDCTGPVSEDLIAPTPTTVSCLDYGFVYADLVDPMSGSVTPLSFTRASGRLIVGDVPVPDYPVLVRLQHGVTVRPDSLIATAVSNTQINLSWQDNTTDETGFAIERSPTPPPGASFVEIATVGPGITAYQDTDSTGLTANTTYYYRVHAYNATDYSAYSNVAYATTYALAAPSGLAATAVSDTQINLSWHDNSSGESGFKIERKTGVGGTYSQIDTVEPNVVTYQNIGLTASTTYYYRVRAYKAGVGYSAYSNVAYAHTYLLATPTNLVATAVSNTQINLSWTQTTIGETGFAIERKTGSSGTWAQIACVGANITTYQNKTGLTAKTTYYYRVRAYKAGVGFSAYSNVAYATTYLLAAPSSLVATAVSNTQINLSWTQTTIGETGFAIERKTGSSGTWAQIACVGANITTYQNKTGLTAKTTYYYRVRAYKAGVGFSAYSNVAYATTYLLAAPSSLVATAVSNSQINLAWHDNSFVETGFAIERAPTAGGTWVQIATVGANVVTYANTSLAANTTYYYRVRAYKVSVGFSAYSNVAYATTYLLAAPSSLAATAVSNTRINLSWTQTTIGETGFAIERAPASGGTWAQIATVGANVVTYANTGLTANTIYYYRVRAYKVSVGYSAYSNVAHATTLP